MQPGYRHQVACTGDRKGLPLLTTDQMPGSDSDRQQDGRKASVCRERMPHPVDELRPEICNAARGRQFSVLDAVNHVTAGANALAKTTSPRSRNHRDWRSLSAGVT